MLLDSFPSLKSQVRRYEKVQEHSLIDWEGKIDPVLYELSKLSGVKKTKVLLDKGKVSFAGNDEAFYDFIKTRGSKISFVEPQLFLHVYSGIDDLSLLRRMKEYPDETPRSEILDYWLAESSEAASILIVNAEKS